MRYQVLLHRLAREDLDRAYLHVARHAPETAARWVSRFEQSLISLEYHPRRCSIARERGKSAEDLREFHFGKRPNVFRVVFCIEGEDVHVLRILRGQLRPLNRRQINEARESD